MGKMTFHLPAELSPALARELEQATLAGGSDNMPYPTATHLHAGQLILDREIEDSGYLMAPWLIDGMGQLMGTSSTLVDRLLPYNFLVELTRGKVNQVRTQLYDWQAGGLVIEPELLERLRQLGIQFGQAVCNEDVNERLAICRHLLAQAYRDADALVQIYIQQVFKIRHQRQPRLDTVLSCPLPIGGLSETESSAFRQTFTRASVPLCWHLIETEETVYRWKDFDQLIDWAETSEMDITAGPLIDFSASQLPAWLWLWERDVSSMRTFMCRFVTAAVRRYRSSIRRWQLTAGSNWASVLGLTEEELMGLTYQLGEAARQVDPSLELILGISQPWGEYMTAAERTSPFIFADNLIRSGLNLAAVNLEIIMGVTNRGSYCRDRLELSRLLDLYALLGVPLQVTLGYPSTQATDPDADPEMQVRAGWWREPPSPASQADWARGFAELALCKPYVQAVNWCHFSDARPHLFPRCGLYDRDEQPLPALKALQALGDEHIR